MDAKISEEACRSLRDNLDNYDDCLQLTGKTQWRLDTLEDPVPFFQALGNLLPNDAILCFEGCGISFEVAEVYSRHKAAKPSNVRRDTIFPISELWHLRFSPALVSDILKLQQSHPLEHLLFHLKIYSDGMLLMWYHDAFSGGHPIISGTIPEDTVMRFTTALNCGFRNEPVDDPVLVKRQLELFLQRHTRQIKRWWEFWK